MLSSAVRAHPPPLPLNELAPWISPSIRGPVVYDSERDKGSDKAYRPNPEVLEQFRPAVEQFIRTGGIDQVPMMKASNLRETLTQFGLSSGISRFTKSQMQERIYSAIESDFGTCNKMFVKPPGTSGGVLFMLCPHGYIYAFKILLRSESVTVSLPHHYFVPCLFSFLEVSQFTFNFLIHIGCSRFDTIH